MAHKRRHVKRRRTRRRVGAMGLKKKDTGAVVLGLAAGLFIGNTINDQIDKMLPKDTSGVITDQTTNFATIGELGLGGLLVFMKSRGKAAPIIKGVGGVMLGAGIIRAIKKLGILSGYQAVPVVGRRRMAGYQSTPVIGRKMVPPQLSGRTPAQLQGFRVNGYLPTGSSVMGAIGGVDSGSGITNSASSSLMQ